MGSVTTSDVYAFWQAHPLGSYEIKADKGTKAYFEELDKIRSRVSRFSWPLYEFEASCGKKVLDVGCGPGWISSVYARNGADIHSVDLTAAAVAMTQKHLELLGYRVKAQVANAENLPFQDGLFDFVCCDGVLHHTPDTFKGAREIHRVLKPGGRALISLYYKNWMLRKYTFGGTLLLMKLLGVRTPHGLDPKASSKLSLDDFARLYDGKDNPLGKIYSAEEGRDLLRESDFKILKTEAHYFPVRFVRQLGALPEWVEKGLDRMCGTMIYYLLEK